MKFFSEFTKYVFFGSMADQPSKVQFHLENISVDSKKKGDTKNMKNQFYDIKVNMADYRRFGGFIYESDFCTNFKRESNPGGSSIAQRIESDLKFDEQCKRNMKTGKKNGGFK